jgi:superfamily II RNA helicase
MATTLRSLLPKEGERLSSDEILARFVGWAGDQGLELYPAQEEAILELLGDKHVVLNTPTGSGKSLVATALHFQSMCEGKVSFYTCPIKALVNEKFFWLCDVFGAENVGMMTGDASINRGAKIVCCTAEVLMNAALRDPELRADRVVMDEFHYYGDRDRGVAWQVPLLCLTQSRFLLMSATLGDTSTIEASLRELTGAEVAVVRSARRPVPLDFEYRETPLHETLEDLVKRGRAPIYLVSFTQRAAAEEAQSLTSVDLLDKAEKEALKAALEGTRFDTPYGKDMQRYLRMGIGLHHAGLLPKYRLAVEKLAQRGMLKVVNGTDTLGMGINIPLKTVVFTQLCKFDGEKTAILTARDFHQIAGRAGRKGFDERGYVVVQAPAHIVENLRLAEKKAQGKKVQMKEPPKKGYFPWDKKTFERLVERGPEPMESRFEVTHSMLLNLLLNPFGGYDRLLAIIARSHGNDWSKKREKRRAAVIFRSLREAGIVKLVERGGGRRGRTVEVASDLQRDFSLHHTLAMYLVDVVERLDKNSPTYALDLLTLVEAILESPEVVLRAQLDKLKTEKLAEMKAAGMEYEERIAELDRMEHPKPLADFIYETFNAFRKLHPWVGDNIRPKSIARDMVERYATFREYVRDYGLQRSEGLLLRYLTDCYKTLAQTVPEGARTPDVEDVLEFLRLELRGVDSSLLDEWEAMCGGGGGGSAAVEAQAAAEAARGKLHLGLDEDRKDLPARLRAELHRLLAALGRRRWDEALAATFPLDEAPAWTEKSLEAAMAAYFAEHPTVDLRPVARRPEHSLVTREGPRRWRAIQKILDPNEPAEEADWMIECVVDLAVARPPEAPLLTLMAVRR